jgi:hypothetical protein
MRICKPFLIRWVRQALLAEARDLRAPTLSQLLLDAIFSEIHLEHLAKDISLGPSLGPHDGFYALNLFSLGDANVVAPTIHIDPVG